MGQVHSGWEAPGQSVVFCGLWARKESPCAASTTAGNPPWRSGAVCCPRCVTHTHNPPPSSSSCRTPTCPCSQQNPPALQHRPSFGKVLPFPEPPISSGCLPRHPHSGDSAVPRKDRLSLRHDGNTEHWQSTEHAGSTPGNHRTLRTGKDL